MRSGRPVEGLRSLLRAANAFSAWQGCRRVGGNRLRAVTSLRNPASPKLRSAVPGFGEKPERPLESRANRSRILKVGKEGRQPAGDSLKSCGWRNPPAGPGSTGKVRCSCREARMSIKELSLPGRRQFWVTVATGGRDEARTATIDVLPCYKECGDNGHRF